MSTLDQAYDALTGAGWAPTRDVAEEGTSYLSLARDGSPYPHLATTGAVVEIFVSDCDCLGNIGNGYLVVEVDDEGHDQVVEEHVPAEDLGPVAYFVLAWAPPGTPNPFCSHRSPHGDACGACDGCLAESHNRSLNR